ncbi:TetR/AcrR family transcriptional regulator [Bacillus sp. DX4.1]|uniref:TetR/AcrR family transcriptional regulator n=1 Tax=Bacillus sp. DX4.1 TaxID=3055867 RepID=UPI0025A1BEE5|nr:TetR/AcrR family transcriptional regulator [Bacillus sp. DX4.1]MDM5187176.1 TetR/AcrR family transcriptional regulator [Bacillus sp. DX4.1]
MARGFTTEEKAKIKENLLKECEKSWVEYGYKKTNIDLLCAKVGISKGAFYIFYQTKEQLFCDVMDQMQERLIRYMNDEITRNPTKEGFMNGFKKMYQEYGKGNWVRNLTSPEFVVLLNKLPKERLENHNPDYTIFILRDAIEKSHLVLKVSEQKVIGTLSALLAILGSKDSLGYDHYEVFELLLHSVIDELFE